MGAGVRCPLVHKPFQGRRERAKRSDSLRDGTGSPYAPGEVPCPKERAVLKRCQTSRLTASCIDTGLPAGRCYFGQSDKPLLETANVHHRRWVMFTETRWYYPNATDLRTHLRGAALRSIRLEHH